LADDKEITTNDDISIEFVEHPESEPRPESEAEVPPHAPGQAVKATVPASSEEAAEKLRLSEEKYLRLRADFENFKKRADRDGQEMQTRSQMELLKRILPFLDNMERAFENIPDELGGAYIQGLELSLGSLESGLKTFGLEEVPALGTQFDPTHHESLGFESEAEKEDNEVVKVWEKGYMFKGKLLRPAKVFINRKGGAAKEAREETKESDNG